MRQADLSDTLNEDIPSALLMVVTLYKTIPRLRITRALFSIKPVTHLMNNCVLPQGACAEFKDLIN
jgi:hypothetical protein